MLTEDAIREKYRAAVADRDAAIEGAKKAQRDARQKIAAVKTMEKAAEQIGVLLV